MKSKIFGLLLVISFIYLATSLAGNIKAFISVPGIVICLAIPFGLSLITSGLKDLVDALFSLRCLFKNNNSIDTKNAIVLKNLISHVYISGILGTLIGFIQILSSGTIEIDSLLKGCGVSLLTIFYAVLISECILRPAILIISRP